jgi:hypothetical protein
MGEGPELDARLKQLFWCAGWLFTGLLLGAASRPQSAVGAVCSESLYFTEFREFRFFLAKEEGFAPDDAEELTPAEIRLRLPAVGEHRAPPFRGLDSTGSVFLVVPRG